ncbi:MAG TPA: hypothetical protein VHZ24_12985 [Pirellulales bacterium]|jgi:Mrp family chromosome partitioning ATPase|nr:hypothetical protein [Pirellulales bacterium]
MSHLLDAIRRIDREFPAAARAGDFATPASDASVQHGSHQHSSPVEIPSLEALELAAEQLAELAALELDEPSDVAVPAALPEDILPADVIVPLLEDDDAAAPKPAPTINIFPDTATAAAYRGVARELVQRFGPGQARSIAVVATDAACDGATVALRLATKIAELEQVSVVIGEIEATSSKGSSTTAASPEAAWITWADDARAWSTAASATRVAGLSRVHLRPPQGQEPTATGLREALEGLCAKFQYVVLHLGHVDMPSAWRWMACCDGVCLAVVPRRLSMAAGKALAERLRAAGAPLIGSVLVE